MTKSRAGLDMRLRWLATGERERAAWSMATVGFGFGRKRSGNRGEDAGVGVELGGGAFARTDGSNIWGGLDFISADAMVGEYSDFAARVELKDSADDFTPGVEPWFTKGDQQNIRFAKPLEGVVVRTAAVGPGFEREHVFFPSRAALIAHHRPNDPPVNSTPIHDPGEGRGDWVAGLHSLTRVRPWSNRLCEPDPRKTTSDPQDDDDLYSALLNFTKSAGDNTGWGAAHFAVADATLSAEAFGFAHPADDGNHDLFRHKAGQVVEGGLHINRTKFGDTGAGIIYSPAEFVNQQWRRGSIGPFVRRVEWREDHFDSHERKCPPGFAEGKKKWMAYDSWRVYEPGDPGGVKAPDENDPGGVKSPTDPGGVKIPTPLKVPYVRPSTATPEEVERPSDYGHPVPNAPDPPGETDWPEGGYSSDGPSYATLSAQMEDYWRIRYGFTERDWLEQPLTGHGIWGAVYENAAANEGKAERWQPVKSRREVLDVENDGWIEAREPALGPGNYTLAGSDVLPHMLYTGITPALEEVVNIRNAFSLGVFSAKGGPGGQKFADAEIGLGARKPNYFGVVAGASLSLDWTRLDDANNPDAVFAIKDEEGADSSTGRFEFAQDVRIDGKLTVTGLLDPTGLELTRVAANPGGTAANTLWQSNGATYADGMLVWESDARFTSHLLVGNSTDGPSVTMAGATFNTSLKVDDAGGDISISVERHSNVPLLAGLLDSHRSRGTHASPTVVQNGDDLLGIYASGYDGADYALSSSIVMEVEEATPGAGAMGGRVRISTASAGSETLADALTVFNDQRVRLSQFLELAEIAAPAAPATGFGRVYFKTDGKVYAKNDGGTEYDLTASGGVTDHGALTGLGDDDHTQYAQEANNLSDLASLPAAFNNLIQALSSGSSIALADVLGFNTGGGGHKKTVQQLWDALNLLTAETAPVYNDKLALYDASAANADSITFANLLGASWVKTIDYTGSGISGKTVTLTGINRAHHLFIVRNDASANEATWWFPGGGTGTIRRMAFSNTTGTECSLSAPAAGSSQVLTINTTGTWINQSTISYRIFVVGTPI